MSGDQMIGRCQVCGKTNVPLTRKYFHYDIPCECHGPTHFEMIEYCKDCVPKEPRESKVTFKTEDLKDPRALAQKIIDFAEQQENKRRLENEAVENKHKTLNL